MDDATNNHQISELHENSCMVLTDMAMVHLPDIAKEHQKDPLSQQYTRFMVWFCFHACQL